MIGKKKVTCLALTALTLISLSSCNDVSTGKNGQILTYDYSGNKLEINTSDIFEKYINENRSDHAKALYDALYEVVVRVNFEKDGLLSSFKKEVEEEATDQVNDEKTKAEDNGQSWEDYLKENVSKDETLSTAQKEQELYLTKLYDNMKTIVEDQYYEEFKDWKEDASSTEDEKKLQQEYNLLYGKQGYINQYMPYHVRHIVIKNDASQDYAYSRGHISSDDAHEIYQVVERLVAGDDFSTVANNFTEDGGNTTDGKLNGGQYIMGIQGTNSAFINEFKLGVYTYDLFLKYNKNGDQLQQNSEKYKSTDPNYQTKEDNLHISDDQREFLENYGVSFIPYGVVNELNSVRNTTTNSSGQTIYNGDEDYLPRNILFNKYFQNRNVAFITNEAALTTNDLIGKNTWSSGDKNTGTYNFGFSTHVDNVSKQTKFSDIDEEGHYQTSGTVDPSVADNSHFNEMTFKINGQEVTKRVLCDTDGNPIMVVRNKESSGGIHFIVIERSAFNVTGEYTTEQKAKLKAQGISDEDIQKGTYQSTLNEYYAPISPKQVDGIDSNTGKPKWISEFPSVQGTVNNSTVNYPKKTYVQPEYIGPNSVVDDTVTNYTAKVNSIDTEMKSLIPEYNRFKWLNGSFDENQNISWKIALESLGSGEDKINLQNLVNTYIEVAEETNKESVNTTLETAWTSYVNSIQTQSKERREYLLPEILATDFGNIELYKVGNPGYNSKYSTIDGSNAQ